MIRVPAVPDDIASWSKESLERFGQLAQEMMAFVKKRVPPGNMIPTGAAQEQANYCIMFLLMEIVRAESRISWLEERLGGVIERMPDPLRMYPGGF
jgi:hypothetical protein